MKEKIKGKLLDTLSFKIKAKEKLDREVQQLQQIETQKQEQVIAEKQKRTRISNEYDMKNKRFLISEKAYIRFMVMMKEIITKEALPKDYAWYLEEYNLKPFIYWTEVEMPLPLNKKDYMAKHGYN